MFLNNSLVKKCIVLVTVVATVLELALHSYGQDQVILPVHQHNDGRQGKGLLDLIGLGTGGDNDPYVARTNENCLNGDLAECFKSRALVTFDEFFDKPHYQLTENVRILRMPEGQLRSLANEPFEFSEHPRSDEPEWDQLVKFGLRKVEKFLKSTAIEVSVDNEVTEHGRYSPRFVDEIADEIDIIEDKKDTLFNRKKLKKLFIPLLIILKLFKLKLLLFLPLILGLASFKKFLGFLAIVIPGAIAFFKLCKPNLQAAGFNFGGFGANNNHGSYGGGNSYYNQPHYSPAGVGYHQSPHYREPTGAFQHTSYPQQEHVYDDNTYYGSGNKGFAFQDSSSSHGGHNQAYSGYGHYRDAGKDIAAGNDVALDVETSSKKSILPDA